MKKASKPPPMLALHADSELPAMLDVDALLLHDLGDEVSRAEQRYGPFTSTHEGLGVLLEEVQELIEAIRANKGESVRHEAVQVAAVAVRLAHYCRGHRAFAERSGW